MQSFRALRHVRGEHTADRARTVARGFLRTRGVWSSSCGAWAAASSWWSPSTCCPSDGGRHGRFAFEGSDTTTISSSTTAPRLAGAAREMDALERDRRAVLLELVLRDASRRRRATSAPRTCSSARRSSEPSPNRSRWIWPTARPSRSRERLEDARRGVASAASRRETPARRTCPARRRRRCRTAPRRRSDRRSARRAGASGTTRSPRSGASCVSCSRLCARCRSYALRQSASPRRTSVVRPDERAAVDPELLERLLEDLCRHARARGELARRDAVGAIAFWISREDDLGRRVVALEEELVRLRVDEGVEEHRARRGAVATGATDLLVVALERRRERGVDHGAHVALSMPMPNAVVATMTSSVPPRNARLHVVAHARARGPRGRRQRARAAWRAPSRAARPPCASARRRSRGAARDRESRRFTTSARSPGFFARRPRRRCSCAGSRG